MGSERSYPGRLTGYRPDTGERPHRVAAGRRRVRAGRVAQLAAGLVATVAVGLLTPAVALGNDYTGMLASGTVSVGSGTSSASAGFVYGDLSWSAPSGTAFRGFAYTAATFSSVSDSSVGGVSAGFGAGGSANQPSILFPWTDDCSITNSGHYWTDDMRVAGTSGQQTCSTAGNTSGWNYTNAEIENTSPATNPQSEYSTLWLTVFCQSGSCPYDSGREWGSAGATVTNLSATVDDPNNQPSASAYWTANNGSSWYQTDSNAPTINVDASDPAGVCATGVWLTGPASSYLQVMDSSPGMENPGSPIGNEFDSITPCPGSGGATVNSSAQLPANLASGTYSLSVLASNPGNWQAGAGLSNAPTVASYANTINIDDTIPTISWTNTSSAWTAATSQQLTVTAGPSGIGALACTDNGTPVAATRIGAGTYSVPTTAQGANTLSCSASNGDVNGELTSGPSDATYNVDTTVPTVSFTDSGYTPGTWVNAPQMVAVTATGGPSGIDSVTCYLDGVEVPLQGAGADQLLVSGDGQHTLECVATSNTNVTGQATYAVWVDARQPTVSFSGAEPAPVWLSGTPTVVVTGGEQGGVLSGVTKIACTVNAGPSIVLSVDSADGYTSSFALTTNGADVVACQASDAAGTTGEAASETVNVDNAALTPAAADLTRYGSSPEIDNGADPYSDGPSQTTWYQTAQSVTITAINTAGGAAISQITCTGASQAAGGGTYPANTQNAYGNGGEQITVTVQPPGGNLACAAKDIAGNTYPLGSYEFEIDNQAPTGYFAPRSSWPAPDVVQLHITDGPQGSGTATVQVSVQQNGGPVYKVMATRNPAEPDTWDAQFNDSTMPKGTYTFIAYPTDAAGNSGQITTNQAGGTETLTLPLRAMSSLQATLTAAGETANGSQQQAINPAANIASATTGRHTHHGRRTSAVAASCKPARADGRRDSKCTGGRPGAKAGRTAFLTLAYGQAATLTGRLLDAKNHDQPIAGALITIDQHVLGRHAITRLGVTRTSRDGRYRFHVPAGASRTILAIYNGSTLTRGAQTNIAEHVKGKATIQITGTLKPGHDLLLKGHLDGGYIPTDGALIMIQYGVKGFRGWTNWGTTHTNRRGSFQVHMPILPADAGYTFQWRAIINTQTGWAYLTGHSNTMTRAIT